MIKTIQIGNLKTNFSEILKDVRKGSEIIISYGRKKEKIAKIVPFKNELDLSEPRKLGIFGNYKYKIKDDFEITEEELLNL